MSESYLTGCWSLVLIYSLLINFSIYKSFHYLDLQIEYSFISLFIIWDRGSTVVNLLEPELFF